VVVPVVIAATLYVRGWVTLARRMPERFGRGRLIAAMAGLATVIVALSSPLDALGHQLLLAHMVQHLLLMAVVPPVLWLGAPVAPMLLGLPRPIRRMVAIALGARPLRRLTHVLGDPRLGWVVFVIAFWAWHIPALYERSLGSDSWHHVQHACFFATALLFWRPVILPWPARSSWPRWAMIPYLALAELQNSTLAAILTFADRVIYPAYETFPRRWDISAIEDQSIAGVIMWVPGSVAFLLPMLWLIVAAIATSASGRPAAPRLTVETRHRGHP
jgi:cytochrome c oxidase assembly factor CtaG